MLREWRALRAAQGDNPAPEVLAGPPDSIVRIRVGEQVQQMALTRSSQPDYPEEARAKGVEGVVTLEAVIGAVGAVQSVSAIGGDPLLVRSALESVKNWTYHPTLLNGMPVEVVTLIEVNFTLQNQAIPRPVARKKR
jgi:TonB family protein